MSIFKLQGDFIDNLPKIYGFYTGGFVVFIVGTMAGLIFVSYRAIERRRLKKERDRQR